jgi:hypothetical protein
MREIAPKISAAALLVPDLPLMLHFVEKVDSPAFGASSTTDESETQPLLDS